MLVFKLADTDRFDAVKQEIESDPRLTLEAKRETRFYADQSEMLSKFISYLGTTISVIFSIGAVIGAMIKMFASVASRTNEIGTLRALGFPRRAIMAAFLVDWILPFTYNIGLDGVRASILPWLFFGGLISIEQIYFAKQDTRPVAL